MRSTCLAVVAALGVLANAQEVPTIKLGQPQFVAKRVKDVFWSPNGRALVYTSEQKDGLAVGVFDVDNDEAKAVLVLKKGQVLDQLHWLASGRKAVALVKDSAETTNVDLCVLDARLMSSTRVWGHQYPKGETPNIGFDVSPLLDHAIVAIATEKTDETWVLTNGGSGFLFSRDIAQAKTEGHMFAGWTTAGTATFGPMNTARGMTMQADDKSARLNVLSELPLTKAVEGVVTFDASPAGAGVIELVGSRLLNLSFRMMPMLQTGDSVLECVPANGALRPVKFPGYFEAKGQPSLYPKSFPQQQELKLGKSQAGTNSLWLVPMSPPQQVAEVTEIPVRQPPIEMAQKPNEGVLVSAQADQWWESPFTRSVAFTWNGALFVRTVSYGQK